MREILDDDRSKRLYIIDINQDVDHKLRAEQVTIFTGQGTGFGKQSVDEFLEVVG